MKPSDVLLDRVRELGIGLPQGVTIRPLNIKNRMDFHWNSMVVMPRKYMWRVGFYGKIRELAKCPSLKAAQQDGDISVSCGCSKSQGCDAKAVGQKKGKK